MELPSTERIDFEVEVSPYGRGQQIWVSPKRMEGKTPGHEDAEYSRTALYPALLKPL